MTGGDAAPDTASEAASPLVMTGVGVRFGKTMTVRDISLTASPGRILALEGPSGAGKTTVLRVAAGLLPPAAGTVRRDPAAVCTTLFQDPRLLPWRTLEQNVLFGLGRRPTPDEQDRAAHLLDRLGLGPAVALRPGEVSGGMQRRAALARALLPGPDLLLADEPFAHLDPAWSDQVEELLAATAQAGTAVLMSAHQPERIRRLAQAVLPVRPTRRPSRQTPGGKP